MRGPFLLRRPDGARAGERSAENVSVVDVFPTLASAMGLRAPDGIDGVDLFEGRVPDDRGVYLESYSGWIAYGWSQIAGWLDARGKYLHSARPELFDPRLDALEEHDLVRERADEVSRYEAAIGAAAALPVLRATDDPIRAELVEKIQSLGYAGAGEAAESLPHPLAPTERPAPQAMGDVYLACNDALAYFNAGAYDEAELVLENVLERDPQNPFALEFLSSALIRQGEHARALEPLRELLAGGRQRASTWFRLGLCLRATGARAEALDAFERSSSLAPDEPRVLLQLAEVCDELGRTEAAAAYRARVP
jgi:tetratricopeptide (TPR) repeat protein